MPEFSQKRQAILGIRVVTKSLKLSKGSGEEGHRKCNLNRHKITCLDDIF